MPKIILASGSRARQEMLTNACIDFEIKPADINERSILNALKKEEINTSGICLHLSEEKARVISSQYPEEYVIGSDQILSMNDEIFSKAKDNEEAFQKLKDFQGKEHYLTAGVVVSKSGKTLWRHTDVAALKMRTMNDQKITEYIDKAGDIVTSCVGCYALEGLGIRLFSDIRGDFFTILGMPLLPLLNFLHDEGILE